MSIFKQLLIVATVALLFSSCEEDDNNKPNNNQEQFQSLNSPYLICANRNPGGIGFDFEYNEEAGGANNLDSLSVDDFNYDMKIRTIKAEKPDGSIAGMPYITLATDTKAVNYSSIDVSCKGYIAFTNLTTDNLQTFTFDSDDTSFDISNLTTGDTGKPLMSDVVNEYNKLVIGDKWKGPAKNDIPNDEPVWIIKTTEGRMGKVIVTDFPASPAPTATGYISLEWDFIN